MTLTQLSAFVLVARLGSVKAAANALGVSEPAVSQALAALRNLAIGAAVFSVLRWRQSAVETGRRIDAERSYRLLVEQAPVVIYAWDPARPTGETAPLFVSPQIEMLLGYSAAEWTADPGLRLDRIHPDDRAAVVARAGCSTPSRRLPHGVSSPPPGRPHRVDPRRGQPREMGLRRTPCKARAAAQHPANCTE